MKRIWKLSESRKADLLLQIPYSKPQTLISLLPNLPKCSPNRRFTNQIPSHSNSPNVLQTIVKLFEERDASYSSRLNDDFRFFRWLTELYDDLITNEADSDKISQILDDKVLPMITKFPSGSASIPLFLKLKPHPQLALEVFDWRRRKDAAGLPMVEVEYSIGIKIAGRLKNVELAVMLFSEASMKGIKTTSIYNALMGVYMFNNDSRKVQAMFRAMKREGNCTPTIVTYNILLSIFGRMALVDHMEETYREILASKLEPNVYTLNSMIAGYLVAWMWGDVDRIYKIMEGGPIKPDLSTHLLMLRGYAHQRNLIKMEDTYNIIKLHVNEKDKPLIRTMIGAYCKSSDKDRVTKVEALLKLLPEEEYRPWLNVLLIRLYAHADLMDEMESFIAQAIKHKTCITTVGTMRSIISTYFRYSAVERFENFLKLAESSGWKICRSLYHCKMVMYSMTNRMVDMESVVEEMGKYNMDPTRKTFLIMYNAYTKWGETYRREKLLGTMCKHGFGVPLDAFPSELIPPCYSTIVCGLKVSGEELSEA